VTDDIRPATGSPVDLLVIGGLTVDVIEGREVAGGAARYAVEGALAAGLSVGLWTVAGDERAVQAWLGTLPVEVQVTRQVAARSIRFEHHGAHDRRRLRLAALTEPIQPGLARTIPRATAVLRAPVAGGGSPASMLTAVAAPARGRAPGLLRIADADGWVQPRALSDLDPTLAAALRGLADPVGRQAASRTSTRPIDRRPRGVRAWAGPGPGAGGHRQMTGEAGRRRRPARPLIPAQVVEAGTRSAAGDVAHWRFAARRGAGDSLFDAARKATASTAHHLAARRPG
jgi:hypothetical protein